MGTLIDRRKHMSAAYRPAGYIQDGLVMWLDGINKGATDGTWVDLVGGKVFSVYTGKPSPMEDSFYFDGRSILRCLSFVPDVKMIEICIKLTQGGTVITNNKDSQQWSIFNESNGFRISAGSKGYDGNLAQLHTISVSESGAIGDGQVLSEVTVSYAITGEGVMCIGGRSWASNQIYATGYIHNIRFYKRLLTTAEILYNQQIDNERFNLGLTI